MRICHITSVHPRYDIRICEKECISLVNAGYEVYLVVNDDMPDEIYKGIHIVSTGVKDNGRMARIVRAPKRVLKKALEIDAEVYHLHDPELLMISDKLSGTRKKVVFDAHEDTEKQIETKRWIPGFLRKIVSESFGLYSHGKFKRMAGLISVTPSIVEKLKQYNKNAVLVTNFPIINDMNGTSGNKLKIEQEKYVFFAGGISEQWCHENIAKAVDKINGVHYIFAGKDQGNYVERIVENRGKTAYYLGLLPHDAVKQYYKEAIAGMAILKTDTQVGRDGTLGNTKLFEVMEAGRPVICSDLKLWREIVEKYSCGICVDSDDIDAIADAIRYLSEHIDESNKMGDNGRRAVEMEFNWSTQEKTLYAFYENIKGLIF